MSADPFHFGYGTTFKMSPAGAVSILRSWGDSSVPDDGMFPDSSLIEGSNGDLFGLVSGGGAVGGGIAIRMTKTGTVTVLHNFADGSVPHDGIGPHSTLLDGHDGYFYGTTFQVVGGSPAPSYASGTAFKVNASGACSQIHLFNADSVTDDGYIPNNVILGLNGNLYGTTQNGGSTVFSDPDRSGFGTIYQMTKSGTEAIMHNFGDGSVTNDGAHPAVIVLGAGGNYYGVTYNGGSTVSVDPQQQGYGTAFKMSPAGVVSILHHFGDGSVIADGIMPNDLFLGSDGNFYGTSFTGGSTGDGVFFKMTPTGVITVLHSFGDGTVQNDASGRILIMQASDGNFYGTSQFGGSTDHGTVFEISFKPFPPSNLAAVAGNASVSLTWQPDANASSYNVYRGTTPGGEGATPLVSGLATASYVDNAVANGVKYYYTVAVVNGNATSPQSSEVAATPSPLPGTPTSLAAAAGNAKVTLSWTASAGATSYNVYRGTTSYGQAVAPIATGITGTTWINTGLTNGVTYYYRIAAFNSYGNSPEGNQASATPVAPPSVPANLTAAPGNARITLSWTGSAGATSYNVYRGTTSYGQAVAPFATGVTGTTYVNTGLTNGVTYYYRIAAFNPGGNSPEGNQAQATPVAPPSVPANLTAAPGNTRVTLTWTASAGATSYSIYRGTTSYGQGGTPIATGIAALTFTNTGLTNGTTYYYRVAAFNASGNSPLGNQAQATPVGPPAVPTNLTAFPGNAKITLTWTAGAGATSYSIYRGTTSYGQAVAPVATGIVGTTYVDAGLTNGVTYYYRAAAFNPGGNSPEGNQTFTTPVAPPPAPTALTVTPGNAKLILSWGSSTGATSYSIYRGTSAGGEGATPVATGVKTLTVTDTGVVNGTTYYYQIAAVNVGGSSTGSEAFGTPIPPPSVPTGLTATAGSDTITLNWTASAGATSYNVYRGTTSYGQASAPYATGIIGTTFTDAAVIVGTTYYYRVAAFNAVGNSPEGNQASAKP